MISGRNKPETATSPEASLAMAKVYFSTVTLTCLHAKGIRATKCDYQQSGIPAGKDNINSLLGDYVFASLDI